ncbi:MAG TPA: response regulator transcription factor [Thermodesulfobacteriota bacterium]|nr:response regulator transcription factor [Thermodesulfobacteriota bacterium]
MRNVNKLTQLVLLSNSKFFLDGIKKILEDEDDIKVMAEALNPAEVKKCIKDVKPEFLFIDNRTPELNVHYPLNLLNGKNCFTKVILFDIYHRNKPAFPHIIYISKEINSVGLIETMRRHGLSNGFQAKKDQSSGYIKLTNRETEIVDLIKIGFSNKRIGRRLSITERTVKSNLTNIFKKLNIQSRYQLMVCAAHFPNTKFA